MKHMYQLSKYKDKKVQISGALIMTALVLSFTLPIFRSGGRTNLNFWEWIINHTVLSPNKVEYVPEEDYMRELNG